MILLILSSTLIAEGGQDPRIDGDWLLTILHTNDVHSHIDAD